MLNSNLIYWDADFHARFDLCFACQDTPLNYTEICLDGLAGTFGQKVTVWATKLHCKALQVLLGVAPQVRVCLSALYLPCVLLCLALAYASNGEDSFCGSIAFPEAYLACPAAFIVHPPPAYSTHIE